MFRNNTVIDTEPPVVAGPADPVPLSVLSLDVTPPAVGWDAFLTEREIPLLVDGIGRPAISRDDARMLLTEHRVEQEAAEARRRAVREEQERAAVESDRAFRAALPKGLHWTDIPVGVPAAEAWRAAELAGQPKRTSPLEEALSNSGTLTYHPLPTSEGES